MIDPLAGPWTVRRNRKRGTRGLDRPVTQAAGPRLGQVPAPAKATAAVGAAAVGAVVGVGATGPAVVDLMSPGDAASALRPPDLMSPGDPTSALRLPSLGVSAPGLPIAAWRDRLARRSGRRTARRSAAGGTRRVRAASRPIRPLIAAPLLALLVVLAIGLVWTISGLLSAAAYKASGAAAAAAPLASPAPGTAGGFRQHYEPLQNLPTLSLIAEFERRFSLFAGSTSQQPGGLYREPATVDLISDQPGWIRYQGFNSPKSLGPPALAAGRLISELIQASGPGTSWQVSSGARGGSARCAITTIQAIRVSICAWATDHTAGALISPDADTRGDELAVLLPLMRLDLQPG